MTLRELILHNLPLKALSFVMAGALWLAIHSNLVRSESAGANTTIRPPENGVFVRPIDVKTSPEDLQAYLVDPPVVSVRINGDSEALKKLNPDDIRVTVDLRRLPVAAGIRFPVEVQLPPNVNVSLQSYRPSNVRVEPVKSQ
jgi:YbbR domain-containing protein